MLPSKPVDLQLQNFCVQLCISDSCQNASENQNPNPHSWDSPKPIYQSLEQDIVQFPIIEDYKQSPWKEIEIKEEEEYSENKEDEHLYCREGGSELLVRAKKRTLSRKLFKQLRRRLDKQISPCEEEGNSVANYMEFEISTEPCNCSKTGCQKMYCECLAKGKLCSSICNCRGCNNRQPNELLFRSMRSIHSGKHDSYSAHRERFRSQRYRDGCTCKKSQCLKKYCECFANGRKCGPGCMCDECLNIDDGEDFEVKFESEPEIVNTRSRSKSTVKAIHEKQKCVQVPKFETRNQGSNLSTKSGFQFILGGMVQNTLNCRLFNQFNLKK